MSQLINKQLISIAEKNPIRPKESHILSFIQKGMTHALPANFNTAPIEGSIWTRIKYPERDKPLPNHLHLSSDIQFSPEYDCYIQGNR